MKKLFLIMVFLITPFLLQADECEISRWGPDDQIGNANLISFHAVVVSLFCVTTISVL